jgi:hypothetical protein
MGLVLNHMKRPIALLAFVLIARAVFAAPPEDFPRYSVPGHEKEMATLRELFWLHYPGSGPKATLWDEWLPDASLWPAVTTDGHADRMRREWSSTLHGRGMDAEGYVHTHQHASIAHQHGWPFPFWNQGRGMGWHFSFKNTAGPGWRKNDLNTPDGWLLNGAHAVGVNEDGWRLEVTNVNAIVTPTPWKFDSFEAPFMQLRWQVTSALTNSQPFIEWTTPSATNFSVARRMYFPSPTSEGMTYEMVPMYRHPLWTNEILQFRIGLGNAATGSVTIQAFFSQYDTRHNINGQNFVRGCAKYFWWTRDLNFLRGEINRIRTALRYVMTEHQALERKVVFTDWVSHDGRTGVRRTADGGKHIVTGQGIGNNYWDLMPFGGLDCYATMQYYDAVLVLAQIEREIAAHPEWQIPRGVLAFTPEFLERHAAEVKATGNKMFWNEKTQRFNACIDSAGEAHDYGYTFLNCEAIYYDFASPEHAKAIMNWINGDGIVEGDTSQGTDIYHWRFAARSTTKRNIDWYFWAWSNPEGIPWGGQVQDGGAVLGWSYHDLMARVKVLGPDNAWARLQEILKWFEETQAAGGYRKYYNGSREGSMQGSGTAGGLGLDMEFFESALVPQVMINGFLGFKPRADGIELNPNLPKDWPEFTLDKVRWQQLVFTIRVSPKVIELRKQGEREEPMFLRLPEGKWKATWLGDQGAALGEAKLAQRKEDGAWEMNWGEAAGIRFEIR